MIKTQIIFFLFAALILSSCKKENVETEIIVQYDLLDDVGPLNTTLFVNEKLTWSEWIINDTIIIIMPEDKNRLEFWFTSLGTSNVKLNARGENGEKYFGNLDIEIPQIANKLVITGFKFDDDYDFNIIEENLEFRFDYYNGSEYTFYSTVISKSTFENNDSLLFDRPIEIDITDFDLIKENQPFINFIIKGENSISRYFKLNFFVKDWYYQHRTYISNYIYLDNFIGSNKERIYLTSDWTR